MSDSDFRIGHGYDVHQLVESIPLIICGVNIESLKGSLGHSDGDVGMHAICDAILGALALGDLGKYFPSNEVLEGANSKDFLLEVLSLMANSQYEINNIDCTIILQTPHINQYIEKMRKNISEICHIDMDKVSVKATTTDKIGSIGRGEGVGASAVVLLGKR
tara:strand:+ start:3785 stop:4270 length:486 start_codon:yes stop_codon:yes gene_type:complete